MLYYILGSFFGIMLLGKAQRVISFFWAGLAVAASGALVTIAYTLTDPGANLLAVTTLSGAALLNGIASASLALLLQFFLAKYAAEMGRKIRGIEPGAMRMLTEYHWPGNIRELENTMERAVLMAEGDRITADDLNLFFAGEGPELQEDAIRLPAQGIRLADAERELIVQALERAGWVQKDAARLLGVSSRALNYKIKSFGITHPTWKQNR